MIQKCPRKRTAVEWNGASRPTEGSNDTGKHAEKDGKGSKENGYGDRRSRMMVRLGCESITEESRRRSRRRGEVEERLRGSQEKVDGEARNPPVLAVFTWAPDRA